MASLPLPATSGGRLTSEAALRAIQQQSRYFFDAAEFAQLTGRASSSSVDRTLRRLEAAGLIVRLSRRPSTCLIVPPEHAHYGAPPVTWWLDDCMRALGGGYYVALLSAARHWGSAHYAVQTTQVMLERSRGAITAGKLTVEFIAKRAVDDTPTVVVSNGVAPWRVSTREATLFDLVRHQSSVGGMESIARIARDLGPELSGDELTRAAHATGQVPVVQRLGFLLDRLQMRQAANRMEDWLSGRRVPVQTLTLGTSENGDESAQVDPRWRIRYNPQHLDMLRELM
ncbi:type IV toxin-antitoxin system AbiEi family antitoxin domain-containing protein [Roseateles amylovorans]|uniref:Type IV toxin-antitoxin system AbiEi family antitoxin n=1 Tax=Roseateles amylovorans TaxID=2978473 RepID=A0ABY6B0I7_9BURK|nr:type IV toxin-antitoxin system AbiEi family antitoxin [Roseateles amylovorans]UXH78712.1 type IV toxin-antitoxin system AbiEi family antitoxin [Roseateles amylovorans]